MNNRLTQIETYKSRLQTQAVDETAVIILQVAKQLFDIISKNAVTVKQSV